MEFKKARAMAKKTIAAKKKESLEKFCGTINRFTNMSYVWNVMRTFKNTKKYINWNKWTHKNREEEIRKETEKLAPTFVSERQIVEQVPENMNDSMEAKFKMEEMTRAVRMIKRNSAPRLDGIEYRMIKELPEEMLHTMLNLFNEIWIQGTIPREWNIYQVMFIDKAGKESVRPIALSSCIGKVMERMINERLVWWAEHHNKFDRDQNGFRRGRSCQENLCRITAGIRIGNYKEEYTLAAYLDVTSAYDNVNYNILMKKLETIRCPVNIRRFISR